jgi:hypothetical protein
MQQVAQVQTVVCTQSAANAAALDYSQPLHRGGVTTQQHITDRHLSGINNVSQYSTSGGFAAVERTNYYTYRFGVQTFTPTGIEFDLVHPLAPLGFTTGTNRSGGDAYTNHLVVKFDCKTVITSYPR